MRLVLFACLVACSSPKPPAQEPKPAGTDWAKVLREVAIAGLRALVCTDTPAPAPAEKPDQAAP